MAVAQGIPDYPFVTIPHPIAVTEVNILHEWAENIMADIESILLQRE